MWLFQFNCYKQWALWFRIWKVTTPYVRWLYTCSVALYFEDALLISRLSWKKNADYLFSNENINSLITYSFDFRNEELLSYYISFLRFAKFQTLCWFSGIILFQLFLAPLVCSTFPPYVCWPIWISSIEEQSVERWTRIPYLCLLRLKM